MPLIEIASVHRDIDPLDQATVEIEIQVVDWFRRITAIVGGAFLLLALVIWAVRPYHYRPVLALMTIAMLMAILHTYAFEDGQDI
ncbi:MAG: hypothetical protein NVS2B16_15930 [Chloroflexota bacterium]